MFPENIKILVVDDFSTVRRIIRSCLTQIGFKNIKEAEDGTNAWRMLQREPFDFVITDWNMPEMTGLELLQTIRMSEAHQHLPVLMVTAEAKKTQIIEAAQAGVNGYIVKPFTMEVLRQKIELIAQREMQKNS